MRASEASEYCAGVASGVGSKRSQQVGGWESPHRPVSTLYVSSGLRFKLRFKPAPLARLAWGDVLPVTSYCG